MTHRELRKLFLEFWKGKGHVAIPSASIVPENDPTTLFTGSGMQPLIPYLLGAPHPLGTRLTDIQKCFRGQDIEDVGDNRHDSFFEMMGNWSLGDYFKQEQLAWYFEFLTKVLGFDKNKLYVTCFEGSAEVPKDTESYQIWKSLGVAEDHIYFYGVKKNWWSRSGPPEQMPPGEIGGPDSEVFYEFTNVPHNPRFGEKCHPNCDCGRFLEIGNSVFIQYQKQPNGRLVELKQKNVDFGGGLERTLAALNDDPDIFKTDVFTTTIHDIVVKSGGDYGKDAKIDRSFRVIADHIKAVVFLINAGVTPSNKDRGYILRRLIRRAVRFGHLIGIKNNYLSDMARSVIETYQEPYPELMNFNFKILEDEEVKFRKTLEAGLRELNKMGKNITAKEAFYVYETFGFPRELIEEELGVDLRAGFEEESRRHREQSRTAAAGKFKGGLADQSEMVTKYHTATHLLQAALRKVLGDSVRQEGSNLTAQRLRFDFAYPAKLTDKEVAKVQSLVNRAINNNLERKVETMSYEEAVKSGALAFFKEKYPEKVTVYSFGDFSREICGGPHVENTGVLGRFEIFKQEAVSSGVRRIYARLS
jgi:alanyl-tRNA synthetase